MITITTEQEKKFLKFLFITTIIIIFLNILDIIFGYPSWQITRLINLKEEANFSTWFSSMLLLIAAFYAFQCSLVAKSIENGCKLWQLLSVVLLIMSVDEVAMIHEHIGMVFKKYFHYSSSIKTPFLITIAPFFVIGTIFFMKKMYYLLRNNKKVMRFLVLGIIIYLLGEFICDLSNNFVNKNLIPFEIIIEEALEMFGVLMIIRGLKEFLVISEVK